MSNLINFYALKAQIKLQQLLNDEKGAVDIVAIVVLIGIVVILAIVFRKQIEGLLSTLFGKITTNATGAIETTT